MTTEEPEATVQEEPADALHVVVNGTPVVLTGKDTYIFVDIFSFYDFDLTASEGRAVITNLNGEKAQYTAQLKDGDQIELAWKEK